MAAGGPSFETPRKRAAPQDAAGMFVIAAVSNRNAGTEYRIRPGACICIVAITPR
jgi:hypothetical protein